MQNPGITLSFGVNGVLLTVFSFVNCEEKGCYRVVSVGHLIFDCRSYCAGAVAVCKILSTVALTCLEHGGFDPLEALNGGAFGRLNWQHSG